MTSPEMSSREMTSEEGFPIFSGDFLVLYNYYTAETQSISASLRLCGENSKTWYLQYISCTPPTYPYSKNQSHSSLINAIPPPYQELPKNEKAFA